MTNPDYSTAFIFTHFHQIESRKVALRQNTGVTSSKRLVEANRLSNTSSRSIDRGLPSDESGGGIHDEPQGFMARTRKSRGT